MSSQSASGSGKVAKSSSSKLSTAKTEIEFRVALIVLVMVALIPAIVSNPYWLGVLIVSMYFAILAGAWNLLAGYTGQFGARSGGVIRCFSCQHEFSPVDATVETFRRLEGASDPDDMLAVLPVTCPECATRGTLVLSYGPEASIEDSEVLQALPDPEHPPTPDPMEGV